MDAPGKRDSTEVVKNEVNKLKKPNMKPILAGAPCWTPSTRPDGITTTATCHNDTRISHSDSHSDTTVKHSDSHYDGHSHSDGHSDRAEPADSAYGQAY